MDDHSDTSHVSVLVSVSGFQAAFTGLWAAWLTTGMVPAQTGAAWTSADTTEPSLGPFIPLHALHPSTGPHWYDPHAHLGREHVNPSPLGPFGRCSYVCGVCIRARVRVLRLYAGIGLERKEGPSV